MEPTLKKPKRSKKENADDAVAITSNDRDASAGSCPTSSASSTGNVPVHNAGVDVGAFGLCMPWIDTPPTVDASKATPVVEEKPTEDRSEAVTKFVDDAMNIIETSDKLDMNKYGFGAWSISKLKVLNKCPLNFYLKYVLKLKVPEIIGGRRETLSADVGTSAHRILELVMLGKTETQAFESAKKEFVPNTLSDEEWVEHVESLSVQISAFRDRMDSFFRRHPVERVFPEMKIGVTKDWKPCAFFAKDAYFRGVIDLPVLLKDGSLIVIDHKTGGFSGGGIKLYETQLNSYKPLFHFGVTPVQGAQAYVHFIRDSEIKSGFYHDKNTITKKLVNDLEWDFSCAVDRVKELGFFKHIAGNTCKWCDYESMCKQDKVLKQVELASKRVIPIKAV